MGESGKDLFVDLEKLLEPIKAVEVKKVFLKTMNIEPYLLYLYRKNGNLSQLFSRQRVL